MVKRTQKYILLRQDGQCIRCRIKHIICIISISGKRYVYEWQHRNGPQVQVFSSGYNLSKFKEEIDDPHFYPIFEGVIFNTRFYQSIDADRNLRTNAPIDIKLVVARKALVGFMKHLLSW
ncbi:MAG: hypothetical protein K9J17_07345 [Flavobacteriales bacterium]|nr:hypothetical protein [Flavobacteriales bacterium]